MTATQDLKKWPAALREELKKDYFIKLEAFLDRERKSGVPIFPETENTFRAFKAAPYKDVKVVILGQDPYHKKGQAHGLSFSVPDGAKRPPSLMNIYKEIGVYESRLGGNLQDWAEQGVFLLNAVLTVREGAAASHKNQGWERFTDSVLKLLNESKTPIVFMLWGSYAQKKAMFLDNKEHLVLQAPHPSPLSAYRGFLGCGHFDKANQFLISKGVDPIKWA